ncbi:PREDICTED: probable E3 SUMO-protein ligase RNF212 [Elephantulus edwardii]|uniref:probable E3 SUMO-protein ligase RNF212 n=1 Tax=Elephantulus edwardii TaxID=28737 RepID=UPI0003F075B6|nr:PREDICTED: probable E3 SUMO-protein ligase RNF212 [Elephantulus edwardii]
MVSKVLALLFFVPLLSAREPHFSQPPYPGPLSKNLPPPFTPLESRKSMQLQSSSSNGGPPVRRLARRLLSSPHLLEPRNPTPERCQSPRCQPPSPRREPRLNHPSLQQPRRDMAVGAQACKKDECLVCKTPCQTVLLSKHTDSSIQAFFMNINGLCAKYSKEISQISEFQEKHRKRLLAFYREKISKLEESLQKTMLRIEQLQSMRSSQQTAFNTVRSSMSTPLAQPSGHHLFPPSASSSERVESMEVDVTPSPMRRPEVAVGPTRMSLISPPQDGRMASQKHPDHRSLAH